MVNKTRTVYLPERFKKEGSDVEHIRHVRTVLVVKEIVNCGMEQWEVTVAQNLEVKTYTTWSKVGAWRIVRDKYPDLMEYASEILGIYDTERMRAW